MGGRHDLLGRATWVSLWFVPGGATPSYYGVNLNLCLMSKMYSHFSICTEYLHCLLSHSSHVRCFLLVFNVFHIFTKARLTI